MADFDLLLRGGTVIDPAADLAAQRDVAVSGGRISAICDPSADTSADQVIDVSGLYVVPGLIDFHVHVFPGVSHYGVDADSSCLGRGVTTAVDFGSSGGLIFDGFREYVLKRAQTRLYSLLHICAQGMLSGKETQPPVGELSDLRYCDVQKVVDTVDRHRDCIIGIKIRLTAGLADDGKNEAPGLELARKAADESGLPLFIHSPGSSLTMPELLPLLRGGDVLTHCYHGRPCGIVDESLQLLPEVKDKLDDGLLLDVGHGVGSFSFPVARSMLDASVVGDFISSDLHQYNIHGPVFDLLTTMDKFLHLGMDLTDIIRRTTINPARFLGKQDDIGHLQSGAIADITVLELIDGEFPLTDSYGKTETGNRRLEVRHVFRAGHQAKTVRRPEPAIAK